jgi:mannose-6-phosphate isomerase-like protein (cupin superfamily)
MTRAGQVFENPVTGERMIVNKTGHETNGTILDIEFFVKPNSETGPNAHVHPHFAEHVEIISGSARYQVGQTQLQASTGDVVILPKDVPHIHPWNIGQDVLHWRKITQLDTSDMQILEAAAGFFESMYALAQQGKVGKNGLPKNLLQTIMLLYSLEPSAYVAGMPIGLQHSLFGILTAIGRVLGFKTSYQATSKM